MNHPYIKYENSQLWNVIKKILNESINNNDIELLTPEEYVIGMFCKCLEEENILKNYTMAKKQS